MNDINSFFEIFYGSLFALSSIALVVNRYSWEQVLGDVEDNHAILMIGGAFALFVGLMTVTLHPYYKIDLGLLTTIFGWIAIAKGILLFILPTWVIRLAHFVTKSSYLHGAAVFLFAVGALELLAGLHAI